MESQLVQALSWCGEFMVWGIVGFSATLGLSAMKDGLIPAAEATEPARGRWTELEPAEGRKPARWRYVERLRDSRGHLYTITIESDIPELPGDSLIVVPGSTGGAR